MVQIYQFASCPYCQRVLRAADRLGLVEGRDYEKIEASRGTPGRAVVVRLGGMSQVPFLVDGDVQMYESADIIDYLAAKFAAPSARA
jgi:glutathione S-transferase